MYKAVGAGVIGVAGAGALYASSELRKKSEEYAKKNSKQDEEPKKTSAMEAVSGALLGGLALADAVGVQLQSIFFPIASQDDAYVQGRAKNALLEGKLLKYEVQRTVWKERTFILGPNKLMWLVLKGEQGKGPVGDVKNDMQLGSDVEVIFDPDAAEASQPERVFTFRVVCKSSPARRKSGVEGTFDEQARISSVTLAAFSAAERQRWMNAIKGTKEEVTPEKFVADFSKSTNICQLGGAWAAKTITHHPEQGGDREGRPEQGGGGDLYLELEGLTVSENKQIIKLDFQHAHALNGYLPESLNTLSCLVTLELQGCSLEGRLPDLSQLVVLQVSHRRVDCWSP
jgi:hypothetical protein